MTRLVYVDCRASYAAAQPSAGDVAITDASPLAALPSLAGHIQDIDALLTQDEANALGDTAITLALAVDDVLRASSLPEQLGLDRDLCQTAGGLCRVAGGLLHRSAAMSRALRTWEPKSLRLITVDRSWFSQKLPLSPDRYGNPFPALADEGFFRALPVERTEAGISPGSSPSEAYPSGLHRRVHVPMPYLMYELAERSGLLRILPRRSGWLVIGHENETLRESLPWLAVRGYGIRRIGNRLAASAPYAPDPVLRKAVDNLLTPVLLAQIERHTFFSSEQCRALSALLVQQVAAGLLATAAALPLVRERIAKAWQGLPGPRVFVTNGLFGLAGAQLYGALKQAGVHVVDFEHGFTTGLSEHSQRKIFYSEASSADAVLVCSDNAGAAFGEARRAAEVRRLTVGIATQTRHVLRKPLQRRLARRALTAAPNVLLVLHVSTWLQSGNMRSGYGTPTERFVVDMDRTLIADVYGRIDKHVVFKPYPTSRFPDEPHLAERVALPDNVRLSPPYDLRYLRAGADLMVTASPTSTLGWVIGAGVPVVWLASRKVNPITTPDWDDRLRAAFITVDVDEEGWADALRVLLSRPMDELQQLWDEKSLVRARLDLDAISGPDGRSGRRPAEVVHRYVSRLPLAAECF